MEKKRKRPGCECADSGCPVHKGAGKCPHGSTSLLVRVDMDDSPLWFCSGCAADAMDSGLFVSAR